MGCLQSTTDKWYVPDDATDGKPMDYNDDIKTPICLGLCGQKVDKMRAHIEMPEGTFLKGQGHGHQFSWRIEGGLRGVKGGVGETRFAVIELYDTGTSGPVEWLNVLDAAALAREKDDMSRNSHTAAVLFAGHKGVTKDDKVKFSALSVNVHRADRGAGKVTIPARNLRIGSEYQVIWLYKPTGTDKETTGAASARPRGLDGVHGGKFKIVKVLAKSAPFQVSDIATMLREQAMQTSRKMQRMLAKQAKQRPAAQLTPARSIASVARRQVLRETFDAIDGDGDGSLTHEEIVDYFTNNDGSPMKGQKVKAKAFEAAFGEADDNDDGEVSYTEFTRVIERADDFETGKMWRSIATDVAERIEQLDRKHKRKAGSQEAAYKSKTPKKKKAKK